MNFLTIINGQKKLASVPSGSYTVTQTAHGLAVQEAIYFDGTVWAKAKADDIETIGVGVVSEVTDANTFTAVFSGGITGLSGLATGEWYYVSGTTAGLITPTEGTVYSNPLLQATSATTGVVVPLRAQDLTGTGPQTILSDYDSTNLHYLYTGTAATGTATSAALWRISRYDFTTGTILYADGNEDYDNVWDDRESLSYI